MRPCLIARLARRTAPTRQVRLGSKPEFQTETLPVSFTRNNLRRNNPEKALGHEPQIDLGVAHQATTAACQRQKAIEVVNARIRMQPRSNYTRSTAQPNRPFTH